MDYISIEFQSGDEESSRSERGFEFRDIPCYDCRKQDYLRENPEHASKYEGKGLIIFPGEYSRSMDYPSLPGAY